MVLSKASCSWRRLLVEWQLEYVNPDEHARLAAVRVALALIGGPGEQGGERRDLGAVRGRGTVTWRGI